MSPLEPLRSTVRPVIFETGIKGYPYSTAGTAFLLGYKGATFIVTARHVVGDYPIEKLVVFPRDSSRQPLHLSQHFRADPSNFSEDLSDFLLVEAKVQFLSALDRKGSHVVHLNDDADAWESSKFTSQFFLIGYPSPKSLVDYELTTIHTGQVLMSGSYIGPSSSRRCHELEVIDPHYLSTFSGFSGSPVFCFTQRFGLPSNLTFCGLAIRGTPASCRVHFLEASVIREAVEQATKMLT